MIKSAKLDLSWGGFLTPLRTPLGAVMRWVRPVCVCLFSLGSLTYQSLALWTSFLVSRYIFTISRPRSSMKVKVTGAKGQTSSTKYTFAGGPPSNDRQSCCALILAHAMCAAIYLGELYELFTIQLLQKPNKYYGTPIGLTSWFTGIWTVV